jgi:hypothetical protein
MPYNLYVGVGLHKAGYRELVFIDSILAERGQPGLWEHFLRHGKYNPSTDHVSCHVHPMSFSMKVFREGEESLRILKSYGRHDEDILEYIGK